ncbi:hypothetical protein [Butyrivibrio sp. FCS014]|uniref:hypothetical protein n=1 Tax=Butyrivibrio sp. FCS014 TaxID=1408304 RepID=UPI0004658E4C|nr:hypothetical protein [Butyrivibrio sp. FCS014]
MLDGTYYTNGKNIFADDKFDNSEWSAPYMVDKAEIAATIKNLNLNGRVIRDIRFVSHAYNLVRHWVEDCAYNRLENLSEEERQQKSEYHNIPLDLPFLRYAKLDEPLLIEFDDHDHLEIDAPQEPEFRISMNCIPWDIEPGCNSLNAEASIIFDSCIGKRIDRVEVATYIAEKDPMCLCEFPNGEKRELVGSVIIWLSDETGICIEPELDFVDVTLIDSNKQILEIPFKQLKSALFNWEDLHDDEKLGFESSCATFWFGDKYRDHRDNCFVDFVTEGGKYSLHIHDDDIILFSLAISVVICKQHDVYDDYELSYDQWKAVLDAADLIVGFNTFDEFMEYFKMVRESTNGKCDLLYYLNNCGKHFWYEKWLHEKEAKDLRGWTELALSPGEKMHIIGF